MKYLVILLFAVGLTLAEKHKDKCSLPRSLVNEIRNYAPVVDKIVNTVVHGELKGRVWSELADFTDTFGSRIAGSENLENAIDYMLKRSKLFDLDNVHGEPVEVPHWVRGNESATLLAPRRHKLNMLGLGGSIGTGPEGITAEAIVVRTFDELKGRAAEAKNRIVVFNQEWVSYGVTVQYRSHAAARVAEIGGLAALVKSVGPFSINSPHTGWMDYETNMTKIPSACITVEDAEMLMRMSQRGSTIRINLKMEAKSLENAISRNTIVEVTGKTHPHQYVLVSGHLDSWDVGQGAMDDGGGAFISWYAPVILKKLGLTPKRTVRAVLWTAEEPGLIGAIAYKKAHNDDNLVLAMESDEGTFNPTGLYMQGTKKARCIVQEILSLFHSINATILEQQDSPGSDIAVWSKTKVPLAALRNDNERYFWFHHSDGDTMKVEDSDVLDRCVALWTAVSYIVADLSTRLPR